MPEQSKFVSILETWTASQEITLSMNMKEMNDSEKSFIEHMVMFSYPVVITKLILDTGISSGVATQIIDSFNKIGILIVDDKKSPAIVNKGMYFDLVAKVYNDL
jgi:hypothetical protein